MTDTPYLRIEATRADSPFVFSCEHAGNDLPRSLHARAFGPRLLSDHVGWDPGAEPLTRRLLHHFGSPAILGRYTRLLVDLNRSPIEPDFIRRHIEGQPIPINRDITPIEKHRRTTRFYDPYHQALDRLLTEHRESDPILVSIHTFTPVWRGLNRPMEYGLLFNNHQSLVATTGRYLSALGRSVAYNEPYSGKRGKIYSINMHGRRHRLRYFEIEVRIDLLVDESGISNIADELTRALNTLPPGRSEPSQRSI